MTPFKCRASSAGSVMTDPKAKSETLSVTCKTKLKEQWIYDHYKREKDITSPAIQKGLLNEESGITMLSSHLAEMLTKNELHKENDFIKGTADLVLDDTVYDIKCSFDIFTFGKAEMTKDYLWQLQVYMELWDKPKASLVYVLTDTPDSIIHSEVRSILWKLQETSSPGESRYDEIYIGIKSQRTYSDIPEVARIKLFDVDRNKEDIQRLYDRVELCREHYNSLTL